MTYPFAAALVHAVGGRVRQVRTARLVENLRRHRRGRGPLGLESVYARASDVLNLVVLMDAPIFAALEASSRHGGN